MIMSAGITGDISVIAQQKARHGLAWLHFADSIEKAVPQAQPTMKHEMCSCA